MCIDASVKGVRVMSDPHSYKYKRRRSFTLFWIILIAVILVALAGYLIGS
jgi:hypothetical protein